LQALLPYGRGSIKASFPEWSRVSCVNPRGWESADEVGQLRRALANTHGPPLRELASGARRAVIVTCDRTRSVPSRFTFPLILEELKRGGISLRNVEVLVATGMHRGETLADVEERVGTEFVSELKVTIHNSDDASQLTRLGELSSGTPLTLNRLVVESDLVVIESTVEPHFFAGFTGGSKVILPGTAGTETILKNHCWQHIADPNSRAGLLRNRIRADGEEAVSHLNKVFALNMVLDDYKRIVFATAGDPVSSFEPAAKLVLDHSLVTLDYKPDVVVTTNGGYPLDRNVYQCVKGIAVPEEVLQRGSRVVMVSECMDGVGHKQFFDLLASGSPEDISQRLRASDSVIPDQWEVQILCRVLQRAPVWFVTRPELRSEIETMHMHYAPTVEAALSAAGLKEAERVLVVPQGPWTILKSQNA
jgi:nickel-dependent lactate racemase